MQFESKKAQALYEERVQEINEFYTQELLKIEDSVESGDDVMAVAARIYMANQHRADLIALAVKSAHEYELREKAFLDMISNAGRVLGRGGLH